jgi:pyridoxal phosphate enzyme (YggS family)
MALLARWQAIQSVLAQATDPTRPVRCVAVSKKQSASAIRTLYQAGQRAFGENYWQEARLKQQALSDCAIEWHFVGRIQSNKIKAIARRFDWVHSVRDAAELTELARARPSNLPPLSVLFQLRVSEGRLTEAEHCMPWRALCQLAARLPGVQARGLMFMPPPGALPSERAALFHSMADCFAELSAQASPCFDTLSMGMSHDFQEAIAAGSTMVRVGTALFGPRK